MFQPDYASVNGIRQHYVKNGQGKLMLFLHGFPEFWYEWKNQLSEFGKQYQAVAPDLRGYNLSSKPAEVDQYAMKYLIEDVRALAEHLSQEPFILVGHDWGGVVAWAFAIAYPELLEKLIIINAPHPIIFQRELRENPAQQKASRYMLLFRSPEAEETLSKNNYKRLVDLVLGEGLKRGYLTVADRDAYLDAWSQPGALTGGLNYYRAAHVGPSTDTTASSVSTMPRPEQASNRDRVMRVPTLVIWGEQDTALLTGNLEGLETVVPDLTVRRIPEGSHWVIHEQPEQINGLIREFVEGK